MATNDDSLDDFFKKKDRKGNKPKKQSTLTNNEELHKQLVIVTSATTAFKENMDFDDDDDDSPQVDNTLVGTRHTEDSQTIPHKHQSHKTKIPDNNHLNEQAINITGGQQQQQQPPQQQQEGEWEEFEDANAKYEQLRLKFSRGNNDNDDEDDDYYDENNLITNDKNNDVTGDREQQKDKHVWKVDQVKQNEITVPSVVEKIEEPLPPPPPPSQPKPSTGAYRPPQMRSGSSVTIVSGVSQKPSKKKEPNLASNEEFPTLGSTVNKK